MAEKRALLGAAALDETGAVREAFRTLPIAQDYTNLYQQLQSLDVAEETEARVFNDLWRFFSRYYDNGDFLTERRYSSREPKFSVPYNGEEVLLHWANRDQYYVKTSERFSDYCFTAGDHTIWFRLQRAEVEQDNVKGDKRHFVLRTQSPLDHDTETQTLTVFFEYRPITEEEEARYLTTYNAQQSKSSRRKTLDRRALCTALEVEILAGLDDANLRVTLGAIPAGKSTSSLGQHLNRYTARNTMDYFVHKDLGGFLRRELDFFLKNEVLRIDDVIGDESGEMMQHVLTRMRVVRQIADKIIAFLAQIEDFQKRLFEKKKFVVQTDYCITLDRVPEGFYPEVLANEAQLAEWRRLYNVDAWEEDLFWQGQFDDAFLRDHPYAMLDTALFDGDFKARLLATFDDLDGATDGLLIHGENFQALNLLQEKCAGQVKCIYIDPPYNKGNDEFTYKDNYQHSSWLTMMTDRLRSTRGLLAHDGIILISIDDVEQPVLRIICNDTFGKVSFLSNLVWKSRQNVDSRATNNISNDHEFILLAYGHAFRGSQKSESKYSNPDSDPRGPWMSDNMVGLRTKQDRPNLHYDILVGVVEDMQTDETSQDKVWKIGEYQTLLGPDVPINQESGTIEVGSYVFVLGTKAENDRFAARYIGNMTRLSEGMPMPSNIYPCTNKGWRYEPSTMAFRILDRRVIWPSDPTGRPRKKSFWRELKSAYTGFSSVVGYTKDGTIETQDIFGEEVISFPKPSRLISTLIEQASDGDATILDFFAGSGPTAHAVMNLNKEDDGSRRYILVEMADYFSTALKPRIQKVAFSANWKDGVPQDREGMSHLFKYQRIESYEDALNNIRVRRPEGAQRRLLYDEFDDYQLHYMLDFETRDSATLLTQEGFETPFNYTLKIQRGHTSPQDTVVDLVETFHYLIGMHVQRLERHEHQGRPYVVSRGEVRSTRTVEKVVVVWRDTENLDLGQEADWANGEDGLLTEPVDRVYVNGPSFINWAQPLEITFRERMEGGRRAA
ncbi:MAG: site-specific DNA-methyltransferase [Chloroflexota bacterium]|nr:site-specific DNA-methyltransferase [Chloroflexota bacterium]